jgi:hypothetical protein
MLTTRVPCGKMRSVGLTGRRIREATMPVVRANDIDAAESGPYSGVGSRPQVRS